MFLSLGAISTGLSLSTENVVYSIASTCSETFPRDVVLFFSIISNSLCVYIHIYFKLTLINMLSARHKMTKIVKLLSETPSFEKAVYSATCVLKDGKVIAVPTDTVYGVAALAQCEEAIKAIYKLKGRDCCKPVAICVGEISDIPKWGKINFPKSLLHDLLPGPVTIVLERQPALNPNLNPDIQTIGIRIPKSKFIQDLALSCNEPLALTSANISSMISTLAIEEFKEIWPYLDMIIDGGVLGHQDPYRLGSTIVDLSQKGLFRIVRHGCSLERTKEIMNRYNLKELT